ncbi:MAG: hypothetical protein WC527_08870 [Candidatus Margulisiibacteriota bacterium]
MDTIKSFFENGLLIAVGIWLIKESRNEYHKSWMLSMIGWTFLAYGLQNIVLSFFHISLTDMFSL